jgi:L-2-hydroxycarboxylate dehydrogenase (NAD+)
MDQARTRVPAAAITGLIEDALARLGLPAVDAAKVAELMTEADLTGADAHGVFRLPQYVRRLKAGGVNAKPDIRVSKTAAATALVDGDNGMGHLVMARAAETAIELAREVGIAWVGARRSNHAGAAGVYATLPLAHNMIGIYSVVASANHMAMWGGAETLLGTNPLAVAIPAGEEAPIVLDIATTVVSYGTVKNYRLQGKHMPEGWMVSRKDGGPLTDPEHQRQPAALVAADRQQQAVGALLGLLAGTLNGAAFGRDVIDFNYDDESACDNGHFIIALDVARFLLFADFTAEIDRHVRNLRNSQRLPGGEAIRLPGEQRQARRDDRVRNGVPMLPELISQLDKLAGELGVKPLRER